MQPLASRSARTLRLQTSDAGDDRQQRHLVGLPPQQMLSGPFSASGEQQLYRYVMYRTIFSRSTLFRADLRTETLSLASRKRSVASVPERKTSRKVMNFKQFRGTSRNFGVFSARRHSSTGPSTRSPASGLMASPANACARLWPVASRDAPTTTGSTPQKGKTQKRTNSFT